MLTTKLMSVEMAKESPKHHLHEQIDENLKRVYEDALKAEIPDRFRQLLAQLKDKERKS